MSGWPSGYSHRLSSERVWVRFPDRASLTWATILLRSVKWAAINKQWMTAVEDCGCKPHVCEERWPRVLDIVKIHFMCMMCGLTAFKMEVITTPQIWVLDCLWSARNFQICSMILPSSHVVFRMLYVVISWWNYSRLSSDDVSSSTSGAKKVWTMEELPSTLHF